jgi:ABC-type multidrug transport system ATPase subunit
MITLKSYSKRYGKFQAIYPTDLSVESGETYALLGPNGSGKSTILKSVVGLSRPTTGEILIHGESLWKNPEEVKAKLAFMPQRLTVPDNLTVGEVLNFFASMKNIEKGRIEEALEHIEIKADMKQHVGELSGGMLQRLGLVITILGDSPIIVLDEPTLNLDLAGMKHFRRYLRQSKSEGKTILFSSHTLLDAEGLADRVGVLVNGRLVLDQSVAEFKEKVKNQTRMVLVLGERKAGLEEIALRSGAHRAEYENGYFFYHADHADQIRILESIRRAGVEILNIATQQPSLDQLVEDHYE